MRAERVEPDLVREASKGVTELEKYLHDATEIANARADARVFVDQVEGLSADQRDVVIRLYMEDRITLSEYTSSLLEDALSEQHRRHTAICDALRGRMCVSVWVLLSALVMSLCAHLLP